MPDPARLTLSRPRGFELVGYGLRQTDAGRFTVVRVTNHADYDLVGGSYALRRRVTRHTGLPGSRKTEQSAIDKAQALVAKDGGTYLGYRADSW